MAELFNLDDSRRGLRKLTPEEMQQFGTKMTEVMEACVTSPDRATIVEGLKKELPQILAKAQDKATILEALSRIYDAFEETMPTKTHADLDSRPRAERMFVLGINELIGVLNEDTTILSREDFFAFVTARLDTIQLVATRQDGKR